VSLASKFQTLRVAFWILLIGFVFLWLVPRIQSPESYIIKKFVPGGDQIIPFGTYELKDQTRGCSKIFDFWGDPGGYFSETNNQKLWINLEILNKGWQQSGHWTSSLYKQKVDYHNGVLIIHYKSSSFGFIYSTIFKGRLERLPSGEILFNKKCVYQRK